MENSKLISVILGKKITEERKRSELIQDRKEAELTSKKREKKDRGIISHHLDLPAVLKRILFCLFYVNFLNNKVKI